MNISASSHIVKNGDLDLESAKLDINPREERLSKMNVISESIIGKSNFYFIISPLNGAQLPKFVFSNPKL